MSSALAPFERLLALAKELTRRRFVGLATVVPLAAACRSKREATSESKAAVDASAPKPRVFGAREWKTVDAITQRILPSDDGPGAREAGVVAFIDRQLAEPPLSAAAPAIIELAKKIELMAQKLHQRSYADLAAAEQDDMIDKLSRGELALGLPEPTLYEVLHTLTLEGFLSDPRHGGNAGQVGWTYVRFPEPTLREPGAPHEHHSLPVVR